jgi:hypothetical protein
MSNFKIIGKGRFIVRDRIINKIGFDSGVLVAIIDNTKEWNLRQALFLINNGLCFAYQLVVNQVIGVLHRKRGYLLEEARSKTLTFLQKNNITILKEEKLNSNLRDAIFQDLCKLRNKIKTDTPIEDHDLDILASYKSQDIDCFVTTNFRHFIELGKSINIFIEPIRKETDEESIRVDKMLRDIFWKKRRIK